MIRLQKRKLMAVLMLLIMSVELLSATGCSSKAKDTYKPVLGLDLDTNVELTIAIPRKSDVPLNTIAVNFMRKYSNVTVALRYVDDYDNNAPKLLQNGEVDLIFTKGPKESETNDALYYDFASDTEIDFSQVTPYITNNYRYTREIDGVETPYMYSVALGAEARGMFVNKTLLAHYGLSVPTNYQEFLNCCSVLKADGKIAIQGNPASTSASLGLAHMVNDVTHDPDKLAVFRDAHSGVSALFEDTMRKVYELATNRYYDYKTIEENGGTMDTTEYGESRWFLGLKIVQDTGALLTPPNNYGEVAFWPYLSSAQPYVQSLIDEYELDTEIAYIAPPLNDEGTNSAAYATPFYGLSASKDGANLIWAREFVNFIFQKEQNELYADLAGIIPNTSSAKEVMAEMFNVDKDTDCTLCGEIYFGFDYNGYTPLNAGLLNTIKCSAEKYMVLCPKDSDGNVIFNTDEDGDYLFLSDGHGEASDSKVYIDDIGDEDEFKKGFAFRSFSYYMQQLENELLKYEGKADG